MALDSFLSLADSKNAALALALAGNFVLALTLWKVYQAKEELHKQMTGFLKDLLPFAIKLKNGQKN